MNRLRRLGTACALALSLIPSAGICARIVFDPWNYAENVLTAARTLEQIQHQVTSLQNEAQMLINEAKQLTSLPTSVLEDIQGNFSEIQGLLQQAERLAYDVQAIDQQFAETYRDTDADLSDQQLFDGARERWQQSLSAFEHVLKVGAGAVEGLAATEAETSTLIGASQSAVGALQATQAGNQLLAVQARQLADLTAMLAAQGRAGALEQARQTAAEEQAREHFRRFMTSSGYQPTTVQMFHD
jgi:P-type conjugative transfer protein TrbJ